MAIKIDHIFLIGVSGLKKIAAVVVAASPVPRGDGKRARGIEGKRRGQTKAARVFKNAGGVIHS